MGTLKVSAAVNPRLTRNWLARARPTWPRNGNRYGLKWLKLLYWKLCFPSSITLFPPKLTVVSGPFRGMRYSLAAQGSYHSTKILGTYEKELHGVVDAIRKLSPSHIIDIGAAEGYYAVGFGRENQPHQRITCFELEEKGRSLLRLIADWNGVSHLEIHGRCGVDALDAVLCLPDCINHKKVVICDVEGYESVLLNPERVSGLRFCSVLVETHDHLVAGVSDLLVARFAKSHAVMQIPTAIRQWKDFPRQSGWALILPRFLALRAMGEGRHPQTWLWMTPLESSSNRACVECFVQ
jgi:hypothetical protein